MLAELALAAVAVVPQAPGSSLEGIQRAVQLRDFLEAAMLQAEQHRLDALRPPPSTPQGQTGSRGGVDWDGIAQCETGGDWSMQGRTFSGGLGFANTTWNGYGGLQYAPNAGQATREQQIAVAWNVYDEHGLSGWGCKAYG